MTENAIQEHIEDYQRPRIKRRTNEYHQTNYCAGQAWPREVCLTAE